MVYGQKIFLKNFYSQLNTFDSLEFDLPIKFVGFGFSGNKFNYNPRGALVVKMFFNFIIPQQIKFQDTISSSIRGFSYDFGWGKALSTKKQKLSCTFYVGFNTGYTKLKTKELGKQLNPFFSPCISIQPKVIIKHIVISVMAEADYDVTDPQWRSFTSKEHSGSIKGFNHTGLSLIGTIGWGPFH